MVCTQQNHRRLTYLKDTLFTQTIDDTFQINKTCNLTVTDIEQFINLTCANRALDHLKPGKAPGHDQVINEMITEAWDIIKSDL